LDLFKGNSFVVLDVDYLNQYATDVGIELGNNPEDANMIVNNLIKDEKGSYDNFVEQNPENLLPDNLQMNIEDCVGLVDKDNLDNCNTPDRSFEDHPSAQSWTEVVKRGRNKIRSKSEKNNVHGRRILEY
jgi:hypothetical protein